ncbi:MAG: hypothetical protein ISF22_02865 [Methanomassiliicoccus sp.]|nr:hypothetical protein [Methanomassiliicoccus sp.]
MGVQVLASNMLPSEAWLTTLTPTPRSTSRCVLPRKKALVDCTKTEIGARAALIRPERLRHERRRPQNPTTEGRGNVKGIRAAHLRDPDGNLIEISMPMPREGWTAELKEDTDRFQKG